MDTIRLTYRLAEFLQSFSRRLAIGLRDSLHTRLIPGSTGTVLILAGALTLSLFTQPARAAALESDQQERECVVLLHGLARTSISMFELEGKLEDAGYVVANISYPSRDHPVEELSRLAVGEGLTACAEHDASAVHFVTHSLGSILVRHYFARHDAPELQRVVMLGPPNQGSELVDALAEFPGFELFNGPSGEQLGTGDETIVQELGPANFELGVIAGSQSINPLYSMLIPGPDDGKVSVESTRMEGMADHMVMPVTHTWMMFNNDVVEQVIHFLKTGKFFHSEP